jgi:hypothetical protein
MADAPGMLGCWYSEIGAVNQILIVQDVPDAGAKVAARLAALTSTNLGKSIRVPPCRAVIQMGRGDLCLPGDGP